MRLATREWGRQGPVALLIHGIMSDARTWRLVGPELAERGYHVVAVDLRGHGGSGRDLDYTPAAYAADLVETMAGCDAPTLAVGHSLGGLALRYALDALRPARAVYVDPAWRFPTLEQGFDPKVFVRFAEWATAESISILNPRWTPEDIEVELAGLSCWDHQTTAALYDLAGTTELPASADIPSLIMLAEASTMLSSDEAALLRERGFAVRVVPGAGHAVHRDDFAGFLGALDGWI